MVVGNKRYSVNMNKYSKVNVKWSDVFSNIENTHENVLIMNFNIMKLLSDYITCYTYYWKHC